MTRSDAPYSVAFDLGLVPERGKELVLTPSETERRAIAQWLEIEALDSLKASVTIQRLGENHYSYAAKFEADVVQACVVTLEPVRAHVSGDYRRELRVKPRVPSARRKKPTPEPQAIDVSLGDDDEGPELIDGPIIDLAAPLLEEVSLALDPYPRAPGVVFEPPVEPEIASDSPFAVLKQLKTAESGVSRPSKDRTHGKKQR